MINNDRASLYGQFDSNNLAYETAGNYMKDLYPALEGTPSEKVQAVVWLVTTEFRTHWKFMPRHEQDRQITRYGIKSLLWWLRNVYKEDYPYVSPEDLVLPE